NRTPSVDIRVPDKRHSAGDQGYGDIAPVVDRRGRDRTDQQIPSDTAGVAGDERQDANAEQVELVLHAGHRAAEGEHERPDKIEREEKRGRRQDWRRRHLARPTWRAKPVTPRPTPRRRFRASD